MILLDTNVVSESLRPRPSPSVLTWLDARPAESIYLCTPVLAELYRGQVSGQEWEGRLVQLTHLLHDRGVEAEVARDDSGVIPILRQHSCPYYELAEADPAICALERKMFEKVLGRGLRLSQCRLDGDRFCDFQAKPVPITPPEPARAG